MGRQPTLRRDVDLRRWATIPVESGNGIDPAITGEPSEERPVRPSRTERVGPSQPQVERPRIGVASGVVPRRSRTGVASSRAWIAGTQCRTVLGPGRRRAK